MNRRAWTLAFILALTAAAFANGLSGDFVWDDRFVLVKNLAIRDLANFPSFFTDPHTASGNPHLVFYRPLRTAIYALAYHAWGLDPFGYHLINLLLHMANVCLVLLVLEQLEVSAGVAAVTAGVFAVHPIVTEAVTNITGLTDVLFVFFYLLAWLAHLRAARSAEWEWRWAVASWVAFAAALLSKEMALTFPILAAVGDRLGSVKPRNWRERSRLAHYGALAVVAIIYLLLRTSFMGGIGQRAEWPGGNPWRTWLMQCYVIVRYVQLVLFPAGQSIRHVVPIPES
ncbi:MAG: hypothetical protein D6815_01505, partial [Candidatus Dadabacteria bacterium]